MSTSPCIPCLLIFHSIYALFIFFYHRSPLLNSSYHTLLLLQPFHFHLIFYDFSKKKKKNPYFPYKLLPFAPLPPIYSIFWPQPKKVNTLSISSILFSFDGFLIYCFYHIYISFDGYCFPITFRFKISYLWEKCCYANDFYLLKFIRS
jgi:hypothetical protein